MRQSGAAEIGAFQQPPGAAAVEGIEVIRLGALVPQRVVHYPEVDLDADLLEVVGKDLTQLGCFRKAPPHRKRDHGDEQFLAVGAQPDTLVVLLVQAHLVEQAVGAVHVVLHRRVREAVMVEASALQRGYLIRLQHTQGR